MTSRSETAHLTRVSRVAPDDDIKKRNSAPSKISILVKKLCPTVMLVIKIRNDALDPSPGQPGNSSGTMDLRARGVPKKDH